MKKRIIALLLLCCMAVTLVGCSKEAADKTNDPTAAPAAPAAQATDAPADTAAAEPVQLTMLTQAANSRQNYNEHPAFLEACERANVEFTKITNIAGNPEKAKLIISTGKYPDIFYRLGMSQQQVWTYAKDGYLVQLDDYLRECCPNLCKILDERDLWDYMYSQDGHIYSLPNISASHGYIADMVPSWINVRWLKTLGLEKPGNLDELYTVLKAFKEGDPNGNGEADEIPWLISSTHGIKSLLPYMVNFSNETSSGIKDGEIFYIYTSDVFYELLEFCTRLYQEGLMYKNYFTTPYEQLAAIGSSGDITGFVNMHAAFPIVGRGEAADSFEMLIFDDIKMNYTPGIGMGTFAITDKCQNIEAALRWADQFYTEEGGRLYQMGVEGESYQVNEDGTWSWIMGDYQDISSLREAYTIQGYVDTTGKTPSLWFNVSDEADHDEKYMNEWREILYETSADKPRPPMVMDDQQSKRWTTLITDLYNYVEEYYAKVIVGELDLEESWPDFVQTMNNMGALEMDAILKDIYQDALNKQ